MATGRGYRNLSPCGPTLRAVTASLLFVDDLAVEVVRKRIKNMNLSVPSAEGPVRVSAPHRVGDREIAGFVDSRRDWIERNRDELRRSPAVHPVADDTVQRIWGRPVPVRVVAGRARVTLLGDDGPLLVRIPPGSDATGRRRIIDRWLRRQVAAAVPALEARWASALGVEVATWTIRRMSTRWGSCTPHTGRITLNLELAAADPDLLEYIVVHEMTHLLEAGHGRRFQRIMDRHIPDWRVRRRTLNRLSPEGGMAPRGG